MKPERIEISYTVQIWDPKRQTWQHYGQRNTLSEARDRQSELREKFDCVRIMEHKETATVVT